MPGWNDIYLAMVDQLYPAGGNDAAGNRKWLLNQTGATSAYLRVAEEYRAEFGRDGLDKLVLQHVPDQSFNPGDLHRQLLQMPWVDVMTTNWDTLLERAADVVEDRVYDVVRTVEEVPEARSPRIIKLHGSFPAHRPFIFTEEDYRTYPDRFAAFVNLARQLAMENTLVLLGFSGDDPNFLFWSGWVRDRLGAKAPLIYLVGALDLSASKRKMLEGRGVRPIDLARLPAYASWPEPLRKQYAVRWFLERLRAAEPYPARRWPRQAAGFVPPLTLVEPAPDVRAPQPEVESAGHDMAPETLRRLVAKWRHDRLVYPGWIVAPLDACSIIWGRIERHLRDVIFGMRGMTAEERLDVLFELNWQLDTALIPLVLTVDDQVLALLDEMVEGYEALDAEAAIKFRALAFGALRHAREEGDEGLFLRWSDWLATRIVHQVEERERLTYERCLRHQANLEIDALEEAVTGWTVEGDAYWHVRRAGLLADLGRDEEAAKVSIHALNEIRSRTMRVGNDIASWSRESYAMLLRSFFLYGETGSWLEHKPVRDRFDQRQDVLAARGCPGRRDFFKLVEDLGQVPPPLQDAVERTARFDIGSTNIKHRLSGVDPRERRLLAYKAIRYQEEVGLPVRIGHVGVGGQILQEAALWLIDVAPNRALDAFMHASPTSANERFEAVFTRSSVARTDLAEAGRLLDRLYGLADAARARVEAGAASSFWADRLKVTIEVISRFTLRLPDRAPDALRLGLALYRSPTFARRMRLGDEIRRLVGRALEAMRDDDRVKSLPTIFAFDIAPEAEGYAHEVVDIVSAVPRNLLAGGRTDGWVSVIAAALTAAGNPALRASAILRLSWLFGANLMDEDEKRRFGQALWDPAHLEDGLPGKTVYHPVAYLTLPVPDTVDVRAAIVTAMLRKDDLTDEIVTQGGLSSLLAADEFVMSEDELLAEIDRLKRFVAGHAPAPEYPDLLGDQRWLLIGQTSSIFGHLARRSIGVAAALPLVHAVAGLDRHPLRLEPAVPALITLGVVGLEEGVGRIRSLLGSGEDEVSAVLLEDALHAMLDGAEPLAAYEDAVWERIADTVIARQPVTLAEVLRFVTYALRKAPERVPLRVDRQLSFGLGLILVETDAAAPRALLGYDPFAARFWASALAARLQEARRGDPAVLAAWTDATVGDPLPDTRRARALYRREPPSEGEAA